MIIRIKRISIWDEYLYKFLFVLFGILYWIYGLTPYIDIVLSILVWIALIPTFFKAIVIIKNKSTDFRIILAFATLFLGLITVLICSHRRATVSMLIYTIIKMVVLSYNSTHKSKDQLKNELEQLLRLVSFLGIVVIGISLITYFLDTSIPYVINSSETATTLYLGVNPGRGSLCGIFANENMLSNLCVITLGSILIQIEKRKNKIIWFCAAIVVLATQLLTASRGGFFGVFVLILVYFWYKYKTIISQDSVNQTLRYLTIIVFIVVILIYLVIGGDINFFGLLNRSQENFDKNTEIRIHLWKAAVLALTDNPNNFLFGIGHNITDVLASFCDVDYASRLYTNVHNAYLQKALEFGIISSVIMIIYFVRMIIPGLSSRKKNDSDYVSIHILEGLIIALLITNIVETDMLGRSFEGTMVWILAGYYYSLST